MTTRGRRAAPARRAVRSPSRVCHTQGHSYPQGSANRDPAQFPQSGRFDIARNPNPHIAFGHGAHFCLGAALSRLEAKVALSDLLERLQRFELARDEPWEPRKAFHVHGPARLPIRFEPGHRVLKA